MHLISTVQLLKKNLLFCIWVWNSKYVELIFGMSFEMLEFYHTLGFHFRWKLVLASPPHAHPPLFPRLSVASTLSSCLLTVVASQSQSPSVFFFSFLLFETFSFFEGNMRLGWTLRLKSRFLNKILNSAITIACFMNCISLFRFHYYVNLI